MAGLHVQLMHAQAALLLLAQQIGLVAASWQHMCAVVILTSKQHQCKPAVLPPSTC